MYEIGCIYIYIYTYINLNTNRNIYTCIPIHIDTYDYLCIICRLYVYK